MKRNKKRKASKKRKAVKKEETFVMHKGNSYCVMKVDVHKTYDDNFDLVMEKVYIEAVRPVYGHIEDVS